MAQFMVIFTLPDIFGIGTVHPLACVEWFTPLRAPDLITGMYAVSRSIRMQRAHADVIEVDRILHDCHTMPKLGRAKVPAWTCENVADCCRTFWLNSYSDLYLFCLIRLHIRHSIPTIQT